LATIILGLTAQLTPSLAELMAIVKILDLLLGGQCRNYAEYNNNVFRKKPSPLIAYCKLLGFHTR
jgi:hypothetical protein